ncbi:MAG: SPASM domain-containing protein [Prevotellaceae bacterium]|nr:SPASM domain-containing protein [Prevotellaceae bacterium]
MEVPYKELKISFFGGEPLKNFAAIKEILNFAKKFTVENKVILTADFTTNATLLTEEMLLYLQNFTCYFQITLDGHKEKHDKTRFYKENHEGTFDIIIENIHKIQKFIPDSKIWVRINFDNKTLEKFPEIIKDLEDLDRQKTFIIIRRVWQLSINKMDKNLILECIQLALDKKFLIDNYVMPRYNPCFADRYNQVLINYDGKIFKCSTIKHFDDRNIEGTIDEETGSVEWDLNKLSEKMNITTPERCRKCKIFPVCLGPCGKYISHVDNENYLCMYQTAGFDMDEFIIYAFKYNQLERELFPK